MNESETNELIIILKKIKRRLMLNQLITFELLEISENELFENMILKNIKQIF